MALSKLDRVTTTICHYWNDFHAVALDGECYTAFLEKAGAEGSYMKFEKDGEFSVASGGDFKPSDRAYKFTVNKEWKNQECHATFTNCAYPNLHIVGHPGTLTVDGKWVEQDSQKEWILEGVPGKNQHFQRMYIMCEDGRKMYFYIKYYDGSYSFKLGCGDGHDTLVDENDVFYFRSELI